ncbi:hypothetical protein [Mixta mediterraneensis]|uniref:hypothetical protein n=1 Tax=Mixta mediterraneensis TaxID=2758443 RepID=UPI001873E6BB|nr:hypothetical protein [Mixta mediterraneensis]MBE5251925.1 hypothetical protein [Mixta mediterraneensis]
MIPVGKMVSKKVGKSIPTAILLLMVFMQYGCVNHHNVENKEASYTLAEYQDMRGLKRRMVLCATQYMLMQQQSEMTLGYRIYDQRIRYETTDNGLSDYMLACSGIITFLPQNDSGVIEIAGR